MKRVREKHTHETRKSYKILSIILQKILLILENQAMKTKKGTNCQVLVNYRTESDFCL